MRTRISLLCIAGLLLGLANVSFAQSGNGSVRGSVRDQTNAVIPGAKLELTNKATNIATRTESNEAGLYVFPSVIPGEYELKVTAPGMDTLSAVVQVQVQVSTTFHAVLRPGTTETTITVASDVTPVTVEDNPALGHVLEHQRIEQLPINGRSIEQLLVTVPGLESPMPGGSIQVRSWGLMPGAHNYFLDGAVLEEPMWEEGTVIRPPGLDTIQEFKVENNATSAKFSRMTNIVMSTKSGTNQVHGAAFATNRDNAYGKARSRTDFGAFPELSRNEYGVNLGGPVYIPHLYNGKNRTFFFSAYEALRNDAPFSMSASVPTAAMRNGDFSGLLDSQGRLTTIYDPLTTDTKTYTRQPFAYGGKINNIDPSRISPVAKYIFSVLPDPTFPDRNPLLEPNWFGAGPDSTRDYTVTERLDHRFTEHDQAYARFTYGGHNRTWDAYNNTVPTLDKVANWEHDNAVNTSVAVNWVHTVSPTLFNEFLSSLAHTWRDRFTGDGVTSYADQLGLPNPFNVAGFPYIQNIGVGASTYLRPYNRNKFDMDFWIFEDNVTKIKGKHEFQFGAHFRYYKLNLLPQQVFTTGVVDYNNSATGLYDPSSTATNPLSAPFTGSNLANTYLGYASYQTPLRKGLFKLRRWEDAFYFQDNIKVTSRFTLNVGVRWQLSPFVHEADGVPIPGFDPANHAIVLGQPLDKLYAMNVTLPSIIKFYQNIGVKFETYQEAHQPQSGANSNWKDWGPHLGAAYRFGDGAKSFIVRGGFARSYFNDGIWTWMDQSAANTPYTASFNNYMLTDAAQSPDGIGNYGLRSVPSIIAGVNSASAVTLDNPLGITPGSTYNWFFNQDYPTNYVNDWNVTIEKEIMSNTLLRVGYVGNHSGNQGMVNSFNEQTPAYIWYVTQNTPLPTGPLANVARRPYDNTTYGTIAEYMKSGWSNYNGVQFQFERRYTKGIAYQVSYVVGNTFRAGDQEGGGGYTSSVAALNQFLPGAVPTDFDQRVRFLSYGRDPSSPKHRLRWNWIVDLPFGRGKAFGRDAHGVLNQIIGGWQVAGLGTINSTYLGLTTSYWNFTGEPLHQYGYQYPIQDCRSGTCHPGYLYYNGYIPANQINSTDPKTGRPNGVMGVPSDYKPAVTPLIPWGSTALPPNAPAGTNVSAYWDTNTVWIPLNDGTVQRTTLNTNLNPWRNQYIPGPRQWNLDASLFKRFRIRESMEARFTLDAFNVFNHPNNSGDNGAQDYMTIGGILDTTGQSNLARQLQISFRLSW